jgi:hypothetical protein
MTCSALVPPLCAKSVRRAGDHRNRRDWRTSPIGGQHFPSHSSGAPNRPPGGGAARRVPACALHRQLATKAAGMRHQPRTRFPSARSGCAGIRERSVTTARPDAAQTIEIFDSNISSAPPTSMTSGSLLATATSDRTQVPESATGRRPTLARTRATTHPLLRTANSATNTWPDAAARRAVARHQRKVTSRGGNRPGAAEAPPPTITNKPTGATNTAQHLANTTVGQRICSPTVGRPCA